MNYSDKFLSELALRWAPVNYQYINLSDKDEHYYTKQDLILPVNFEYYKVDGVDPQISYDTQKVKDRLRSLNINQLTPVGYYSVAITKNHFYILYSFYHADDTFHPNDMEGCLVILERFGNKEELLGMITVAHEKTPKYSYDDNLRLNDGIKSKPRKMFVEDEGGELHPLIQQEAGKHGMYGLGFPLFRIKFWRYIKSIVGLKSNIVVFYPYKPAKKYNQDDLLRYKDTVHYASFYYDLVHILDEKQGLYHRRVKDGKKNSTFDDNGQFHGKAANPPWLWKYDGVNLWDDPALLAEKWLVPSKNRKLFREEVLPSDETKYERKMNGKKN